MEKLNSPPSPQNAQAVIILLSLYSEVARRIWRNSAPFCGVTNATAGIEAAGHDALTLRARDGLERRF
jgi:hypothetical protein